MINWLSIVRNCAISCKYWHFVSLTTIQNYCNGNNENKYILNKNQKIELHR